MAYTITHDGSYFTVRLDNSRTVLATFSNSMAAETFVAKQRLKDEAASQDAPAPELRREVRQRHTADNRG